MTSESEAAIKKVLSSGDDYYRILGVDKSADDDAIKKAYRKLALRLHPDKCKEPKAEEAFKKVGEAFSVLSDSSKRSQYDRFGADGVREGSGGMQAHAGMNPQDIFEAFFAQAGGMPAGFHVHGGPGGFQSFHFTSMGPGGVRFSTMRGPGGDMGGDPFMGGPRRRKPPAQSREPEEEEVPEGNELLGLLAQFLPLLGPVLPILLFLFAGIFIAIAGTILKFVLSRGLLFAPLLMYTEGRTRVLLVVAL
eukprot:CAMPEP_0178428378 /NCGR_PEP_ID=MMETSP0689_2-20121128/30247_1 /TAXON_ID=160604 /ORGANISM="Amphidinium massartii, Strain CS-259" /LENGTH=248 /DNA_ID=CAMNT_0020050149 /DNA_START=18 /DNA_END=761 /DNA_ORIENTATION=+